MRITTTYRKVGAFYIAWLTADQNSQCHAALRSRTGAPLFINKFHFFDYKVMALKSRMFVVKIADCVLRR